MGEQTAAERVRHRLEEVTGHSGRIAGKSMVFRCPAHEDRDPSLSVTPIVGQVLVHCHADCNTADVMAALGLTMADLYDDRRAVYRYDSGRVVTRYYDRTGGKKFSQSGDKTKAELYHLSRLLEAGPGAVFLVEGEKDVHAIEAVDGIATTAPQGASNFAKVDVEPLRGRHVTAVVDRDEAGEKWAARVNKKLTGVVAGLRFARAKTGKDAADHIAAGHSLDDLEVIPGPDQATDEEPTEETSYVDRLRAALVDTAGLDAIPDPQPLIGEDIVFRDCLVWVVGKPGSSKSFLALDWAGSIATGETWHGHRVHRGPVLYVVAEGMSGVKKRVRAWEKATGQAMTSVHFLPIAVPARDASAWQALAELVADLQPVLVVIDTQARVTVGLDENSNTEMGMFVERCEALRRVCGATVAIVHHIGAAGERGRGATALDGAVSTIVKVAKDGEQVTLTCQKSKDGPDWDEITLRLAPMGESVVLAADDGTRPAGSAASACAKSLTRWAETFADEWVSASAVVKADVFAERTFYRYRLQLVRDGLLERTGAGRTTRYRLVNADG